MGFLAKDSLIGILFSGSRSKCLVQKIEAALKELVFGAYPQYRDDKDINIMLTYILYGCYYAFYENRKYGDVPVLSSITELTGKTAQAALKMIKNKSTSMHATLNMIKTKSTLEVCNFATTKQSPIFIAGGQ